MDNFTFEDFYTQFAMKSKPVVIEGAAYRMTTGEPWTADFIAKWCGGKPALLQKRSRRDGSDQKRQTWADLEETSRVSIADVINGIFRGDRAGWNASETTGKHWNASEEFVFDWSLNQFCPDITRFYRVPKYFASDFLQRVPPEKA